MAETSKQMSNMSSDNAIRSAYNQEDASLTVASFISANVGNKVVKSNVDSVTENLSYYNGAVLLYTIQIIYTSSTKEDFISMERIV